MKTKLMKYLTPVLIVSLLLTGCSTQGTSKSTSPSTDPVADQTKLNNKTNSAISSLDEAIADKREEVSSLKATLDNSKPSTEA